MVQKYGMFGYEDVVIAVYDPSIEDISKRKIDTAKNVDDFSARYGIYHSSVRRALKSKKRIFSPVLNKDLALRLENREKGTTNTRDNKVLTRAVSPALSTSY